MNTVPAVSAFRKFLRGLVFTGLGLLLPVQLALLWLASLDAPVQLPSSLTETLTDRLAQQGLRLQARHFWILPDQSLAADDVTLEVVGLTGEVFTATRVEVGVSLPELLAGRVSPTRIRLRGGKLWCPASVSRLGQSRLLIEDIRLEARREGRWLMVPSLLARSGKFVAAFHGELPSAILQRDAAGDETSAGASPPERVAKLLRQIEETLLVAERSGGASLNVDARGDAEGGARLRGHAVLGNDWSQEGLGLIQARELLALGELEMNAQGALLSWRARITGKQLSFRDITAGQLTLQLDGTDSLVDTQGHLSLDAVSVAQFSGLSLRSKLSRTLSPSGQASLRARFNAATATSSVHGLAIWTPAATATERDGFSLRIPEGQIAAVDLHRAVPAIETALAPLAGDLTGVLNLSDIQAERTAAGWRVDGEVSFSGLDVLGLSPRAVAPSRNLPFSTKFSFAPERTPYALLLRDTHLASVVGEADCSLDPGGPFALRLRGELQPSALDRLLGDWWIDLWKLFAAKQHPYATIDVNSHWGDHQSEVRGRVLLQEFTFMQAPFRSVEILVDADAKGTKIGLHRLNGGGQVDGSLDGSVVWDWSKKDSAAGPFIQLRGNLQPWVAARCVSADLGEAMRGLRLPRDHELRLDIQPKGLDLDVKARVTCEGAFTAWGIESRGLTLDVSSQMQDLQISAELALANGQATLGIRGDPLKDSHVSLVLKGCDPKKVAKIVEQFDPPKPTAAATPPTTTPAPTPPGGPGKLDLKFAGTINLQTPRLLKGRGNFELLDPDLKRVRLLGGVSNFLEAIGIKATSYDLTQASGQFGCLGGRAYFPDLVIKGPDARLTLAGEIDLQASTLEFEGDFSLPKKDGFNPLEILNINRAFLSLSRVRLKGPLADPEISALANLSDILNPKKESNLGKIPPSLLE
jgi:hypothetical protein